MRAGLCGRGLAPDGFPVPGEEFVHPGVRQFGDASEDIGEIGAIHKKRGSKWGIGEECGLDVRVSEGKLSDRPFQCHDRVHVHASVAVMAPGGYRRQASRPKKLRGI